MVTPCVGVWIETLPKNPQTLKVLVTPCVGVWIETVKKNIVLIPTKVTPCVGVWIETFITLMISKRIYCHTLRGCVD